MFKLKCQHDELVDKVRKVMVQLYGEEAHSTGYKWLYGGVRGCDNMHEVMEFLTDENFHNVVKILQDQAGYTMRKLNRLERLTAWACYQLYKRDIISNGGPLHRLWVWVANPHR